MALPAGVTTATLTFGPYLDSEGAVQYEGLVGFVAPSSPVRHIATGAVIVAQPIKVVIGQDGMGSVVLPQTDQTSVIPRGFTYTLTWQVGRFDGSPGNLTFQLPVSMGTTVDFDSLVPASPSVSVPTGVVAVNGKSGSVLLTASDVGADPAGAASAAVSDSAIAAAYGAQTGTKVAADPLVKAAYGSPYGAKVGAGNAPAAQRRTASLPKVAATSPTITPGTPFAQSSITNAVAVALTDPRIYRSGGTLEAQFTGSNGSTYYSTAITGGYSAHRIEFGTDAPAFELDCARDADVALLIDGEWATAAAITATVAGSSQYYLRIDLGSRRPRNIVAYVNNNLSRIMIGPNDALWHATTPPSPRFCFLSDSVGQQTPDGFVYGGPYVLGAMLLGWYDCEASAIGGTGFLNNNGSFTTFRQRAQADVLNRSPDVIGVFGGINDQGLQPKAALQAETTALFGMLRAGAPGKLIVAGGPWQPKESLAASQNYLDVRDAILGGLRTIAGPWLHIDPLTGGWTASDGRTGAPSGPWITGDGTTAAPTGTGNADLYIFDGTHPNGPGSLYAAHRFASSISAALAGFTF